MRLKDVITKLPRFSTPAVPELRYIETAVHKVHARWPDVSPIINPREREELAIQIRDRVARDDWTDTRISFVLAAASAVLDPERRGRKDLNAARAFLFEEVHASRSDTFLSGMLAAHLESFEPGAAHTTVLARALDATRSRMSPSGQRLLTEVPELLDPQDGPRRLAVRMVRMASPFLDLSLAGLGNPHGTGFMDRAHEVLSTIVRPDLTTRERIDWYLNWLRPPGRGARTSGAERAIEALTFPWLKKAPADEIRSHLVESLIEIYGDPRIRDGGVWAGVDPEHMRVIHRWLTREDIRFFTGVVDQAQRDAMWPPRRDFWLKLYEEGLIDAAWVAFSSQATSYAREHMMRQEARNADSRFGFQRARQGTNTSLLIMRIGNKIMVDGCHSYRTHVFDKDDPMAPELFLDGYDCDEIMRSSTAAMAHNSIRNWSRWVRDMINADVKRSERTRPYTKIFRPQATGPRYASPHRPAPPAHMSSSSYLDRARSHRLAASHYKAQNSVSETSRRAAPPPAGQDAVGGDTSMRESEFRSLTDSLIACGPDGVSAVLSLLEGPKYGATRRFISPKAREGLEWIRASRGAPPSRLRNALEHLLISLKNSGRDLDALFSARPAPGVEKWTPVSAPPEPGRTVSDTSDDYPPLPDTGAERLNLLRRHGEALKELAMGKPKFVALTLDAALAKLMSNSPNLRSFEIYDLQKLYEQLREGKND